MGINYRLLDKEKKEEDRKTRMGVRQPNASRDNSAKEVGEVRNSEDTV